MFRTKRKTLVDDAEKLIRKIGLTDKTVCFILRALHFGVSIFTIITLFFGSKNWVLLVFILNIMIYILFYIFEGCILSSLEHRFTNEQFTVIDPFLSLMNVPLTNENRYTYSIYSSLFGFSLTLGIYYVRFIYKKGVNIKKFVLEGEEVTSL